VISVSSAALHGSAAYAVDFRTLLYSFPGKYSARYKLLERKIIFYSLVISTPFNKLCLGM
jgi:hypothetical protein